MRSILRMLAPVAFLAAQAGQAEPMPGSSILDDLLNGRDIALSDRRLADYSRICLIGYDLIGRPRAPCDVAEENSVVAFRRDNGACMRLLSRRDLRAREVNVLMDGEEFCTDIPSEISMSVVEGVPGLRRSIHISFNSR